jgi:hypothetical protein
MSEPAPLKEEIEPDRQSKNFIARSQARYWQNFMKENEITETTEKIQDRACRVCRELMATSFIPGWHPGL